MTLADNFPMDRKVFKDVSPDRRLSGHCYRPIRRSFLIGNV